MEDDNNIRLVNTKDEIEQHIGELEEYLLTIRQNRFYSMQQIDYLLIGVSASGILLLLGLLKDFKTQIQINKETFGIAIGCYFSCILFNFLSHLFAFYSNDVELEIVKGKIRKLRGFDFSKAKRVGYSFKQFSSNQKVSNRMERCVFYLNHLCVLLVMVGLVASIIFWVGLLDL